MASPHGRLLDALLASAPTTPASSLDAAVDVASATGDVDMLARFARRAGLTGHAYQVLRDCSTLPVRAAFLTRPDVTAQELAALLADEKRAGVLASVLDAAGHDATVLRIVEDVFTARPTATLACALLPCPVRPSAAALLVQTLATGHSRLSLGDQAAFLDKACGLAKDPASVHLLDPVIGQLPASVMKAVLGCEHVTDRSEHAALDAMLAVSRPDPYLAALETLVSRTQQTSILTRVVTHFTDDAGRAVSHTPGDTARLVRLVKYAQGRLAPADPDAQPATRPPLAVDGPITTMSKPTALQLAREGSDPARLAELAARTVGMSRIWADVARWLVANTATPLEAISDLVIDGDAVHPQVTLHLVAQRLRREAVTEPHCQAIVDAALRRWPRHAIEAGLLDMHADRPAAIRGMFTPWVTKSGTLVPRPVRESLTIVSAMLAASDDPQGDLQHVPAALLSDAILVPSPQEWFPTLLAVLDGELGSSVPRWEAYAAMAPQFPGTFAELLRAVDLVCPARPDA